MVRRDAVRERVRAAGILGDIAADGTCGLARRVGGVMQPVRRRRTRQRDVHDTGLDDRESFDRVDRQDARESIEADEHDVVRQRTTGQASAGAARHERNTVFGEQPNDCYEFIARSRKDAEAWLLRVTGQAIAPVDDELVRTGQDTARADDVREARREIGRHRHLAAYGPRPLPLARP